MHSSRSSISTRPGHRLALGLVILIVAAGWALSASGRAPGGAEAAGAALNERPNIVLIQTDDQTYRQFSRQVMPNTKRLLANHGTTFRNYIATTAQCCPSRASLITGQYAHNDGVTSNGVGYRGLVDKGNILPVWLQQAGYLTLHVGKFMNGYQQFADPPSSSRRAGTSGTASSAGPGTTTTTSTPTATCHTAAAGQRRTPRRWPITKPSS